MTKNLIVKALRVLAKKLRGICERQKIQKVVFSQESIIVRKEKGKSRLYARKYPERTERYLPKSATGEIKALAQNRYDHLLLRQAEIELQQTEACLRILEPKADVEGVYESMPEVLKPYITASETTDKGYAQRWQAAKVRQSRRLGEGEGFKTMRGEYVRSKSEVIIADRLHMAGIPYRYEVFYPMEFEDISYVYPDFQILNVRTGKEFLWEHLGMLGDSDYLMAQLKKLAGYSRDGLYPGRGLLLSFESKDRPLSIEYVDGLIREFLL